VPGLDEPSTRLPTDRPPAVTLRNASGSVAEVNVYGAHVTSWKDGSGREHLFLSRRAWFGGGRSIRGGIPVVFPQFASMGPLPKHGLLRTRIWTIVRSSNDRALLRTQDDAESRRLWPHRFTVDLEISLTESLEIVMTVTNDGAEPFPFTAALHTYFRVDDITRARVEGLAGLSYIDKVRDNAVFTETDPGITVGGEIDRIYVNGPRDVRIANALGASAIDLRSEGFGDWVVWNPWAELTSTFVDMEPEEYRTMLCVEAARITSPVTLAPRAEWVGRMALSAD
jgi:glucose-6-phosphate 1-epimerase